MQTTVYSKNGLINSHHKHNPYITAYFRFDFKNDAIGLNFYIIDSEEFVCFLKLFITVCGE